MGCTVAAPRHVFRASWVESLIVWRMSRLCSSLLRMRTGWGQLVCVWRSEWFMRRQNSNTSCSCVHIYPLHILNNILDRLLWVKSCKICKQMSSKRDGYFVSGCWKWISCSFIRHLVSNPFPILSFFSPLFPTIQVWSRECFFLQPQPSWLQHHRHSWGWWLWTCWAGRGH